MKSRYDVNARKRPVNLTLNEQVVVQARELTANLSGVVESLLADFVEQERQKRVARTRSFEKTIVTWNEFNDKFGSFADEYSTL